MTALAAVLYAAWLLRWPLLVAAAVTTVAHALARHFTPSSSTSIREDHLR